MKKVILTVVITAALFSGIFYAFQNASNETTGYAILYFPLGEYAVVYPDGTITKDKIPAFNTDKRLSMISSKMNELRKQGYELVSSSESIFVMLKK